MSIDMSSRIGIQIKRHDSVALYTLPVEPAYIKPVGPKDGTGCHVNLIAAIVNYIVANWSQFK